MRKIVVFVIMLIAIISFDANARDAVFSTKTIKWFCYYGADKKVLNNGYKLAILESGNIGKVVRTKTQKRIAYMSIGEVNKNNPIYKTIANKPWVIDGNSTWGSVRVDVRNPEWQNIVVNRLARDIVTKGYDGFFLDNGDIGKYLEETASYKGKYKGARKAVVTIIAKLRKAYPGKIIVPNGLIAAIDAPQYVDAVLAESTVSKWFEINTTNTINAKNGIGKSGTVNIGYGPHTSQSDLKWLEMMVKRINKKGIPVLGLEYAVRNTANVAAAAKKIGLHPYVTEMTLQQPPK